ncbi:OppA family ABC transporter substrate-binding lipoprotein [Mycoplasma todarodis]|uniref:Solute-binding protein family 5 domain-containing protein n=1 Tax=Mycoplasma todarodis TaxID=1937191 RepID=A0A4R0XTH0_9MOLU|nr:hypothetical protein [Mycoplasma todarodis]TCG10929.1 hypothetical protein C4B25_02695 [Mycoplasma todarodis]
MTKKTKQISMGTVAAVLTITVPTVMAVSCGSNDRDISSFYKFKRTEINIYGTLAPLPQRTFDPQYISGNGVNEDYGSSARSLPLLRTKATGDNIAIPNTDVTKTNPKDQIKWKEQQKEQYEFQGAKAIFGSMDGKTWKEVKPSDIKNGAVTVSGQKDFKGYQYYKFQIRKTKWTTIDNEESKYTLSARDYYYGMMRSLASARSVRNDGTLNGNKIPGLPKFSSSLSDTNDRTLNNTNGYLLDLFGVDVKKTIEDGEKLGKDNDEFVVSLTKPSAIILDSLFANNSYFTPAPSQKIVELAHGSKKPEVKYGISTYGKDGDQFSGIKDILHVSPYFYTKYSFLSGYVMVKNKHYWDKDFVNDKERITKYTYHITPEGADAQAEALSRKTGYENGLESILDKKAWANPDVQNKIRINADKYGARLSKVFKVGLQNKLLWNPTMPKDLETKYSSKGIEAMYGKDIKTREQSLTKPEALNGFFNGTGMEVRKAMDAAYNWYAGSVAVSGTTQKIALLSPLAPEQKTTVTRKGNDGLTIWDLIVENNEHPRGKGNTVVDDSIWAKPTIVPSYFEMKDRYNKEKNQIEASKSPAFSLAKDLFAKVAKEIGASKSNPAIIPLQTWGAADKAKDSSETVKQWETMIKVFNLAGDGAVKFEKVTPSTWSTHLNAFQRNQAEFEYAAWSPDYPAAASSLQGITTIERTGIIAGQMLDMLNPNKQPELAKLAKQYNINEATLKTLNANDIYKMSQNNTEDLAPEKVKLMNAAKKITSDGYLLKATDDAFMKETVTYLQDHAVYYRPIISEKYTSIVPDREMGGTTVEVYKKWLHKRMLKSGTGFLQDFSADLD